MVAEHDTGTDRPTKTKPVEIFCSYAHEDEKFRQELEKHLAMLRQKGLIVLWHDRKIEAGTDWAHEIDSHLNTADIILLLISADFINSDYCFGLEMQRALERHKAGEAIVIPIILRSVYWKNAPFAHLEALPEEGKPVDSSFGRNHDEAFTNVVEGIHKVIERLRPNDVNIGTHVAPKPAQHSVIFNVPFARSPYFTGRADLLNRLHDTLSKNGTAALPQPAAISGLGGIGKTQTAVEYAYRHRDEYSHVFWLRSETASGLATDYATIAELLNLPEGNQPNQDLKVAAVKRWLQAHSDWLLIFDNADDTSLVQPYLPANSKGHIILTTRTQFPGRFAHKIEIEKMEDDEGMLFLLRRSDLLPDNVPDKQAIPAKRTKALKVVRELDGLPLALEQAASYIDQNACGLHGYLEDYRKQRSTLLEHDPSNPDYNKTVATTWKDDFQNIEAANHAAADLLRLCAFLIPEVIPEEIVSDGVTELDPPLKSLSSTLKFNGAIGELRKYSLIKRDPNKRILSIHRLVQAVLSDQMDEATQHIWVERAIRAVNEVFPKSSYGTRSQCKRLLPQAQFCAVHLKQYDLAFIEAANLFDRVATYLRKQGQYWQAQLLYQQALTITKQVRGVEHLDTALADNNLAFLYYLQGQYEQAKILYLEALQIFKQVDNDNDYPHTADVLNNLALVYHIQGQYADAELLYLRSLDISEQLLEPDDPAIVAILKNLANLYSDQGQYEQAERLYIRALAFYEDLASDAPEQHDPPAYRDPDAQPVVRHKPSDDFPDDPDIAIILHDRGKHYQRMGRFEDAERDYQQALGMQERKLGEHPETALTLSDIAGLYKQQGRYEEAKPFYRRAIDIDKKVLGPKHPAFVTDSEEYDDLLERMRIVEKAEQWARRRRK